MITLKYEIKILILGLIIQFCSCGYDEGYAEDDLNDGNGPGGIGPNPNNRQPQVFGPPPNQPGNPFGGPPNQPSNPFGGPPNQPSNPFGGPPNQPGNPFGGTPNQPSNPFGGPPNQPTNPFGGPPNQPSNPFGGPPNQPSNPFGGPPNQPSNPFGGPPNQPGNPFGGPNKPNNPFGGPPNQPGNPFGGPPNQPSNPFGGPPNQPSNPFGGPPNQPGNPFGGPNKPSNPFGGPPNQPSNPFGGPPNQPSNPFGGQPGNPSQPKPSGNRLDLELGSVEDNGRPGGNPFDAIKNGLFGNGKPGSGLLGSLFGRPNGGNPTNSRPSFNPFESVKEAMFGNGKPPPQPMIDNPPNVPMIDRDAPGPFPGPVSPTVDDDNKLVFIDNTGNKDLGKIQVNVYIGVLCPASRDFVVNHLFPAWKEFSEVIFINFVPFTGKDPEREKANVQLACIVNQIADVKSKTNMIRCLMDYSKKGRNQDQVLQYCANLCHKSQNLDKIKSCTDAPGANKILDHTKELAEKDGVSKIPAVVIDGVKKDSADCLKNFKKAIMERATEKGLDDMLTLTNMNQIIDAPLIL